MTKSYLASHCILRVATTPTLRVPSIQSKMQTVSHVHTLSHSSQTFVPYHALRLVVRITIVHPIPIPSFVVAWQSHSMGLILRQSPQVDLKETRRQQEHLISPLLQLGLIHRPIEWIR